MECRSHVCVWYVHIIPWTLHMTKKKGVQLCLELSIFMYFITTCTLYRSEQEGILVIGVGNFRRNSRNCCRESINSKVEELSQQQSTAHVIEAVTEVWPTQAESLIGKDGPERI